MRRRRRRRKQLLETLRKIEDTADWNRKALDRTVWRTWFARGCGSVVRQTTDKVRRCWKLMVLLRWVQLVILSEPQGHSDSSQKWDNTCTPNASFHFVTIFMHLARRRGGEGARLITQSLFCAHVFYAFFFFNAPLQFFLPLLNLGSLIFGLTPSSCLRSPTLTPNFWWEYFFFIFFFFFFLCWRYNPLWVLDLSVIFFHSFLSLLSF
jgi:hypothetical protein